MSKNYLPEPPQVSLYGDLLKAFTDSGKKVEYCSHGQSGGIPSIIKRQMNKAARKALNCQQLNQRRSA